MATAAEGAQQPYFQMPFVPGDGYVLRGADRHGENGAENLLRTVHEAFSSGDYPIQNETDWSLYDAVVQVVAGYEQARGIIRRIIDYISRCFGCTPTIDQLKTWEHEIGEMEQVMVGEYPRSFFTNRIETTAATLARFSDEADEVPLDFDSGSFFDLAQTLSQGLKQAYAQKVSESAWNDTDALWDAQADLDRLIFVFVARSLDQEQPSLEEAAQFLSLATTTGKRRKVSSDATYGIHGTSEELASEVVNMLLKQGDPVAALNAIRGLADRHMCESLLREIADVICKRAEQDKDLSEERCDALLYITKMLSGKDYGKQTKIQDITAGACLAAGKPEWADKIYTGRMTKADIALKIITALFDQGKYAQILARAESEMNFWGYREGYHALLERLEKADSSFATEIEALRKEFPLKE